MIYQRHLSAHYHCFLFVLLTLFSSTHAFATEKNSSITPINGWIRETTPGAQNAVAYLSLHNNGSTIKHIVAVQCEGVAARCELHEHIHTSNGGMRMQKVEAPLAIPGNGTLIFAPGGYHIMLLGIAAPLRSGSTVSLIFILDDQSALSVPLPVKSIRAE